MVSFAVQKLSSLIRSHLYILDINPLSISWLANIFPCSVDYLLILFMVSFAVQKHLSLIRCLLFIFVVVVVLLFSCSAMSDSLQPHGLQHTRLPCPSQSPRVCPGSCLLSQWCYPTTLYFTTPLSFCLHSSQHQGFFQWVSCSYQAARALELQLQHQSFQWIFRVGFL